MNAAISLLVYSVVCCLLSVISYATCSFTIHCEVYIHRRTGRKAAGRRVDDKVPARRKRSFLSKRALVQSRVQCSPVQGLLQTLKVQFGAFHFSIRHLQVLIVGFTHYTVATGLLMYS